jgi:hypothetical protein
MRRTSLETKQPLGSQLAALERLQTISEADDEESK